MGAQKRALRSLAQVVVMQLIMQGIIITGVVIMGRVEHLIPVHILEGSGVKINAIALMLLPQIRVKHVTKAYVTKFVILTKITLVLTVNAAMVSAGPILERLRLIVLKIARIVRAWDVLGVELIIT